MKTKKENIVEFQIVLDGDNNVVIAGNRISGHVRLDASKTLHKVKELRLTFQGLEDVLIRFATTTSSDHESMSSKTYSSITKKEEFLRQEIILDDSHMIHRTTKTIQPGVYCLPFDCQLPCTLPPTMSQSNKCRSKGGDCKISYKLEAVLVGTAKWCFGKDQCTEKDMVVLPMPQQRTVMPLLVEPETRHVVTCGCIRLGDITLGVHVEDTQLVRGQSPKVRLALVNDSRRNVIFIQATLFQRTHFHARRRNRVIRTPLANGVFQPKYNKLNRQGRQQRYRDPNRLEKNNQFILETLQGKQQSSLPMSALPYGSSCIDTFCGRRIRVEHEIVVQLITNQNWFPSYIALSVPVKIVSTKEDHDLKVHCKSSNYRDLVGRERILEDL